MFIVEVTTDEESTANQTSAESSKKTYLMRTRRTLDDKKKREEKLITAELKMKYATYIDIIPDLKDMPYFDLLFVQRESRTCPTTIPAAVSDKNKINYVPKRFPLTYTKNTLYNLPSSSSSPSPSLKMEDRVATLKRTWSSSNISEVSSTSTTTSSAETSEDDESEYRQSLMRREFTSTVSSESLKLTIKLKQPLRHRLPSSSSESSIESNTSNHSNHCQQKHSPCQQHLKHSPCQNHQKGVRSSARLRTKEGGAPDQQHLHHLTSKLLSAKRNRIIIQKKCSCCH